MCKLASGSVHGKGPGVAGWDSPASAAARQLTHRCMCTACRQSALLQDGSILFMTLFPACQLGHPSGHLTRSCKHVPPLAPLSSCLKPLSTAPPEILPPGVHQSLAAPFETHLPQQLPHLRILLLLQAKQVLLML